MPRRGFVLTEAVVGEMRGQKFVVVLENGHRVHVRRKLREAVSQPAIKPGDRVWVEIPVSDPTQGIVVIDERQI